MQLSHDAQLLLLGAAIALISSLIGILVQDRVAARRKKIEREEKRIEREEKREEEQKKIDEAIKSFYEEDKPPE